MNCENKKLSFKQTFGRLLFFQVGTCMYELLVFRRKNGVVKCNYYTISTVTVIVNQMTNLMSIIICFFKSLFLSLLRLIES